MNYFPLSWNLWTKKFLFTLFYNKSEILSSGFKFFLGRGIEKMNFPEKMKYFRISHGYTQEEFARLVGVSNSAISSYELGIRVPDMYKAVKIATLMGTTCEELVSERRCE